MARKNLTRPYLVATAQSLGSAFQTLPMSVDYLDNVGIILDAKSVTTNSGNFAVQVRFKVVETGQFSNWGTLTLDVIPTLANASVAIAINLNQIPFSEFRVTFTPGGGTPNGTVDVWLSARQVGG